MKHWKNFGILISVLTLIWGYQIADAQQNLAQQAYAIFDQHCVSCHGADGYAKEQLLIEHTALIETGSVVRGNPDASELYKRLVEERLEKRMPLNQPSLPQDAINTIRRWIEEGAQDWEEVPEINPTPEIKPRFITNEAILKAIHTHVESLDAFDRPFVRYFTLTHIYNAGATDDNPRDNLRAYRNALSKLVNSLSWGREVVKPKPIDDTEETILYIDLRHYGWNIRDRWSQIEQAYPYSPYSKYFVPPTYTTLRQEMECEVPFIRADWFIAKASLPPLYHEILDLPETDTELETRLEINVAKNLKDAPDVRVWRAGFTDSGVSRNNRIVERHTSQHGAYWKTYDFAGSVGRQNIFTHPLDFKHDGGEIIFNLPNGLQAYYLSDASGERLDEAPINIVSNTGARDPVVRNGLSCMGCHTEGMRQFKDEVRLVIERNPDPPYDKAQALRLYTVESKMNALIEEDKQRYKQAVEAADGGFGGTEPIQQLVKKFQDPLDAAHAAAEVGLKTDDFLQKIRENGSLRNLGLLALTVSRMKRDTWESQFSEVIFVLDGYTGIIPGSTDKLDLAPAVLSNGYTDISARSVTFSPDSGILAIGGDDGTIQLWDAGTGKHLQTLVGFEGYIDILAFSSDGRTLVSGRTQEKSLNLWDVDTGHKIPGIIWASRGTTLINVASNADGRMLAAIGGVASGEFDLWEANPVGVNRFKRLKFFSGHRVPVDVIAFSPDGSTLASSGSGDRTIRLWDATTGEHLKVLTGHNSDILSIAFSPDGRVLASGSDREIRLWNASTGRHLQTLTGYTADVSCVSFSVDGHILAGGSDGEIRLWDVVTGGELKKLLVDGYVRQIAFSPDGRKLASAVDGRLYLWDIVISTTPVLTDTDVNEDGNVNILDIVVISNNFGPASADNARVDVNADGIINIQDLVLVAAAIDIDGAAPSLLPQSLNMLTSVEVQLWLIQAQRLDITDAISQRGILFLEYLLAALTPKETSLLPNYPNPFNPETWIPYQLAEPADVTVSIYSVNGELVRRLTLGHQPVDVYTSRSRAAYWDGKNALGEPVASGLYFYTLTAGDFTATRKMLIRK